MNDTAEPVLPRILALLRRDPLRNIVALKLLIANPSHIGMHFLEDGASEAVLLVARQEEFDRLAYPEADASVLLSSDNDGLTRELLRNLPPNERYVFKLSSVREAAIVSQAFRLQRRTAFHSYTLEKPILDTDGRVDISARLKPELLPLLREQGHEERWLGPLLNTGRAFTCSIAEQGNPLSVCVAFQIDAGLWEIGGVYTVPEARRRGLARRLVGRALVELAAKGKRPRYQVAEANQASIHLAEALGMERFLTLTHYSGEAIVPFR